MLVDDSETDRTRKLTFNCGQFDLLNELVHTNAYISHTHYSNHHTTIMLGADDYLVSVDVMVGEDPDAEPKSFDDYFSPVAEDISEPDKSSDKYTSVIFHPYIEDRALSKKTGRNYIKEMDACAKYIINTVTNK